MLPFWSLFQIGAAWRMEPWPALSIVAIVFLFGIHLARRTWLRGYGLKMTVAWLLVGGATLIIAFALIYMKTGISATAGDTNTLHDFGTCAYFSIVTWTTVVYGDYVPTKTAKPFAAIEAIISYVYMGLALGMIVHAMMQEKKTSASR